MASTNKHWPSLFKSKPCNAHHQWQHDINPYHQKASYTSERSTGIANDRTNSMAAASSGTCEERSPEPKPRWNPKPEQIRILEAIFNSGMVNPPRDEIRKIRAQLQEYGQVGDANVFYWFQNRKSRSKHKQRQLQTTRGQSRSGTASARVPVTAAAAATATSSSSSSSEQSSGSDKNLPSVASIAVGLASASPAPSAPATSVNPMYFHSPLELGGDSFLFQGPQGICISAAELTRIVGAPEHVSSLSPVLWSDLMGHNQEYKNGEDEAKAKNMQLHHDGYGIDASSAVVSAASAGAAATVGVPATATVSSPIHVIQGLGVAGLGVSCNNGGGAPAKSTVFINEVAFEVSAGPFNVREAFGEEAVLIHSSGHPVLTDEWGVTIHPLQHGASYYLV